MTQNRRKNDLDILDKLCYTGLVKIVRPKGFISFGFFIAVAGKGVKRMNALKFLRKKAGLTQAALSAKAGLPKSAVVAISRFESGKAVLPSSWQEKIATVLGVAPESFVAKGGWPVQRRGRKPLGR